MSLPAQILHILLKDVRAFRLEISILVLLNLLCVFVTVAGWATMVERSFDPDNLSLMIELGLVTAGLVVLASAILIARVVQADVPASSRQFWLTRPFSRSALLIAKLLFIFVFVHLLTGLSHGVILTVSGVPFSATDIAINQLAYAAMLSLPVAVMASLLPSLGRFLLVFPAVAAVSLVVLLLSGVLGKDAYINLGGLIDANPHALNNWLRAGAGLTLIACICSIGLVTQYRKRMSLHVAGVCLLGYCLVGVVVLAFPRSLASWANSQRFDRQDSMPVLGLREITGDPQILTRRRGADNHFELPAFIVGTDPIWDNVIELPLEIYDRDPRLLELGNAVVRISPVTGKRFSVDGAIWRRQDGFWLRFRVPRDRYSGMRNEPANVRVSLDVLELSVREAGSIPADGSPVTIDSREQCGIAWQSELICRFAYRRTGDWSIDSPSGSEWFLNVLSSEIGTLPISLSPISLFRFEPDRNLVRDPRREIRQLRAPIPVVIREPSAYDRVSMEIDSIRLADFSLDGTSTEAP